VVSFKV